MFRLIYFNPAAGYRTFDCKQVERLSEGERLVADAEAMIICVVDYYNKAILHKCSDYETHREQIDPLIFDPKVMGLYY
jgi:hypothetical protein